MNADPFRAVAREPVLDDGEEHGDDEEEGQADDEVGQQEGERAGHAVGPLELEGVQVLEECGHVGHGHEGHEGAAEEDGVDVGLDVLLLRAEAQGRRCPSGWRGRGT